MSSVWTNVLIVVDKDEMNVGTAKCRLLCMWPISGHQPVALQGIPSQSPFISVKRKNNKPCIPILFYFSLAVLAVGAPDLAALCAAGPESKSL